jgi:hypothetical protein
MRHNSAQHNDHVMQLLGILLLGSVTVITVVLYFLQH